MLLQEIYLTDIAEHKEIKFMQRYVLKHCFNITILEIN